MTIEELCEQTNLYKVEFVTAMKSRWVPGGWYRTGIDMSKSLIWEIPTDYVNRQYAIVYKNQGKISILTDITFMGEKNPIVQGHYTNFNFNNPNLIELVENAKRLLDKYSVYDKQNKVDKELEKIGKDFK